MNGEGGFKINIHAHSIFSDGQNTPYRMALEAKRLGFTALVITDHFSGSHFPGGRITSDRMFMLRIACREAREVLPVIIGLEVTMLGQEILLFGGAAIKRMLTFPNTGWLTLSAIEALRKDTGCAMILAHPGENFKKAASVCDGFERVNSSQHFFKSGRSLENLEGLQEWCNSDAHNIGKFGWCYNKVDKKITNENQLIKYIKSNKQPEHVIPIEDDNLRIRSCTKGK
jgi:predicted metal-dependent phosphoesterase TrpH